MVFVETTVRRKKKESVGFVDRYTYREYVKSKSDSNAEDVEREEDD